MKNNTGILYMTMILLKYYYLKLGNNDTRKAQRPTSSIYLHFNKNYTNYMSLYA